MAYAWFLIVLCYFNEPSTNLLFDNSKSINFQAQKRPGNIFHT